MADIGKIQPRELVEEMRESYLDYAMSVIVARALPDVRDGLKPVHRRILFAMHEMGLTAGAKFRKCAAIVGETLAKYHPHGDVAVYDTLARMAQDFSLRYPLVDGQGNFGCFTKDTKVRLTDGRDLSFGELINEHAEGKRNFTFTIDSQGHIAVAEIHAPRLTREHAELIEVVIDNGERIRCTPDHRFMLRDGTYREAQFLSPGEPLTPLYRRTYEGTDKNFKGYEEIYQPTANNWAFTHHLADAFNLAKEIYTKSCGRIRHHLDFNKLNNNPTNIQRMHWREHWETHYRLTARRHRTDPLYRAKLAAGRKAFWNNPENKLRTAERISQWNARRWQNAEYRARMRLFLSEMNKEFLRNHPERVEEIRRRASRTMKRLWRDPVHEARMRINIIKGNKNHTTNRTGLTKFLAVCRHLLSQGAFLDQKNYEMARGVIYPYGCATTWETAVLKYFQNDSSKIIEAVRKNHAVKSVRRLTTREDVYDITIEGTHNFALAAGIFVHNSVDGDSPAAMRYTEAKMTKIAEELLRDIAKDTVNFRDNYDGTRQEPIVLPASVPNLLLNGTLGIAVGMATNIPPHHLGEVVDALIHLIDHPKNGSHEELMEFIKGPDFPTGGIIYDEKTIREAYAGGKGAILARGKAEIEDSVKRGAQIVVTEIPYAVNKAELIETIAHLVTEKRMEGIRDLRDESDKDGLRIVIELKGDAHPQKVLNNLYKHTDLEKSFNLNMLALVDGLQPKVLSLKEVLEEFLKHRNEVVTRRTQFDLTRTRERIHILEGLTRALDHIDRVIDAIKKSPDRETAHANLMKKFDLSELQATAILEMRLQTLAGLERQKIEDELKEKVALAKSLEALLKDPKKIMDVIKKELLDIKASHGDERKTRVVKYSPRELSDEDLIADEEVVVMLTRGGYIKRIKPENYRVQKRGGKGLMGIETKEEDMVEHLLTCTTHADLLFFTDAGKVYQVKTYEIPEGSRTSKGKAIYNFLSLAQTERVNSILAVSKTKKGKEVSAEGFAVMVTRHGIIKKVEANSFEHVRRSGLIAMTLKSGDELRWAKRTSGTDDLLLVTKNGQSIRFSERDIRAMGRQAAGVTAMRLKKDDAIVGMNVISMKSSAPDEIGEGLGASGKLLVISENGYGKQTTVKQYKKQRRGGSGIKTAKVTPKTGSIIGTAVISGEAEELIAISQKGQVIRTPLSAIPMLGRATQGVRIMKLEAGDAVASITTL